MVLARPPTTWAPASSFVPAPRRWAHNSGCFPSAAPGASTSLQLSAGQVLGDGGPFFAAGGARSYGMWSFQIRECPCPPHCKVASCGKQGLGGGGYESFRIFFLFFFFKTCRAAERLGAASGTERRWLGFPHAPVTS